MLGLTTPCPHPRSGCVLQCYAILEIMNGGGTPSRATIFSVFVSALTTGFLSASIVYDMDTSPQFRELQPVWFGMFADSSMRRGASFFCLMVISTLMLIARSLAYALLLTTRLKFAVYFFFGEMAFYFLQKALRNDLWYWVPVDGALGVFMSGAIHFALKVIVDFTGCAFNPNHVSLKH